MISLNRRRIKPVKNVKKSEKIIPVPDICEICAPLNTSDCVPCFTSNVDNSYTIDYGTAELYDYSRYAPNYFRYVSPDAPTYPDYEKTIATIAENPYGTCLFMQLSSYPEFTKGFTVNSSAIRLWPTEELYLRLFPSSDLSSDAAKSIDTFRNQWFAFILNIEKSTIFFYKQKLTCNNERTPWPAYFAAQASQNPRTGQFLIRVLDAENYPLTQLDQVALYTLSVNYFANFSDTSNNLKGRRKNPFSPALILDLLNGKIKVDSPLLTQVNFFEFINYSYILLSQAFSISNRLLNGLETGLPKEFVAKFFPRERQLLYYNTYFSWIQSRNSYLGFGGMRINAGDGSSTNIQIPNNLILKALNSNSIIN